MSLSSPLAVSARSEVKMPNRMATSSRLTFTEYPLRRQNQFLLRPRRVNGAEIDERNAVRHGSPPLVQITRGCLHTDACCHLFRALHVGMANTVHDNPERSRLNLMWKVRRIRQLRRDGDALNIVHTSVPRELNGKGYGSDSCAARSTSSAAAARRCGHVRLRPLFPPNIRNMPIWSHSA